MIRPSDPRTEAAPDLETLEALVRTARQHGASAAAVIKAADIRVDERLARFCLNPPCPGYGLGLSCPPHVAGPSGFEELKNRFEHAIVFKMDLLTETLLGVKKDEALSLLHVIAAAVERAAVEAGSPEARSFAAGSCKAIFCRDHALCRVLSKEGPCRNPSVARPSMSGFGVDVQGLMDAAGWIMRWVTHSHSTEQPPIASICGLILAF